MCCPLPFPPPQAGEGQGGGSGRGRSHGRRALRLSAFRLRLFLSFLPVRSYPSVIRAKRRFAHASTGIGLLHWSMEHRMKSVVTTFKCAVAKLGRKDAPRECLVIASAKLARSNPGPLPSLPRMRGRVRVGEI